MNDINGFPMDEFHNFCKTPLAVLSWLRDKAPIPVVAQFLRDIAEYETTDVVDDLYRDHKAEIEDWMFLDWRDWYRGFDEEDIEDLGKEEIEGWEKEGGVA